VNARGDVLFVADVEGGSSPRGLFLYINATQSIVNVAAIEPVSIASLVEHSPYTPGQNWK
jgi:hypothetical protein